MTWWTSEALSANIEGLQSPDLMMVQISRGPTFFSEKSPRKSSCWSLYLGHEVTRWGKSWDIQSAGADVRIGDFKAMEVLLAESMSGEDLG